ncbi:hypothetical protein GQX74_002369 [Glossina fuscipes]|nr:hypothetical protein GQX74_002369 [Glossina fuscipes]
MIFDRYAVSGSSTEDYELGAFRQFPHNLSATNPLHTLNFPNNSDLPYQPPPPPLPNGCRPSTSPRGRLSFENSTQPPNVPLVNTSLPSHAPAAVVSHSQVEHLLNSKLQAERLLLCVARLQPICDLEPRENGVYTKFNPCVNVPCILNLSKRYFRIETYQQNYDK